MLIIAYAVSVAVLSAPASRVAGTIATVRESLTVYPCAFPHTIQLPPFTLPTGVSMMLFGMAVCPWKASVKFSVNNCVCASHPHPLCVTTVMTAVIGINAVETLSVGVPTVYVILTCGWMVEVIQNGLHNRSLNVASKLNWFATGVAAKPTGEIVIIFRPPSSLIATASRCASASTIDSLRNGLCLL